MSDFHDVLAEETLRLAENLRAADANSLYADLVQQCRKDPGRVVQMLMCALIWVDVDGPTVDLIHRAENVAANNNAAALRLVPDVDGWVEVTLRRDIHSVVGLLAAGSVQRAVPNSPGVWRVRVTEQESVVVAETAINQGGVRRKSLLRGRDAREEYEFARKKLGYSHLAAVQWLLDQYGVSERQLYRWGFHNPRSEVAS
jgi:hypothetical protein